VLLPAVVIGAGAWATGADNQQLFYVLTILLGVLGAAVPLRVIALASLLAAAGMAAPHIADGSWTIGAAVAAGLLPPLFWLILEQLVRFMLRLHQTNQPPPSRPERIRVWVERPPPPRDPLAASTGTLQDDEAPDVSGVETPAVRGAELTARQLQVLLLCAEGRQHGEIGECLQIGAVQVGRHLQNACDRVQVATNAELMAWAIGRGLIPPDETDRACTASRESGKRPSAGHLEPHTQN
jgi:DNA-binding CsgD family transcriptional regulator